MSGELDYSPASFTPAIREISKVNAHRSIANVVATARAAPGISQSDPALFCPIGHNMAAHFIIQNQSNRIITGPQP